MSHWLTRLRICFWLKLKENNHPLQAKLQNYKEVVNPVGFVDETSTGRGHTTQATGIIRHSLKQLIDIQTRDAFLQENAKFVCSTAAENC